ncbi:hypothetical protein PoB_003760900 [Plakobranchus ocellatus]|uniref:Uncharacterized protein n=1 Tax=Plakobranchus ocellatus TaxID=259542 RepID=A0AAV4ATH6_9GAST|nr:hypothetical protein PoB_003760900 [Plakobranchus ocellatus]
MLVNMSHLVVIMPPRDAQWFCGCTWEVPGVEGAAEIPNLSVSRNASVPMTWAHDARTSHGMRGLPGRDANITQVIEIKECL